MKIVISKAIDMLALGEEVGMEEKDLIVLRESELSEHEFEFVTCFDSDGCQDGVIQPDSFCLARQLEIITGRLEPFYRYIWYAHLISALKRALDEYAESNDAVIEAAKEYDAELEQMQQLALGG